MSEGKALADRVVIVTGGGRGIGSGISEVVAGAGAHVAIIYPVASEEVHAKSMIAKIEKAGGKASSYLCDIGYREQIESTVAKIHKDLGRIDGLVNNAGICNFASFFEITPENWQRHLDVNLSGIFYLLRSLFPVMKAQKSGSIVAFTSGLATNGWPGAAAYATTKAGIVGLVKSAAHELRPFGVRINAVSPGLVLTPVFLDSASSEELAMYERSLGLSKPEEVVPTLLYLISDAGETISGNVVERRLIPRA